MNYSRVLHIDLETYSSVDLGQSGVYRYAVSPDFKILLFAYSTGGDVTVVDLNTEGIPHEVIKDLSDPDVLKVAHNAAFERTCLSRWLGRQLDPDQWCCTMAWAQNLGLPASLAQLGTVLGLPEDKQKLTAGKRLIRYFCMPCKPTKANGGRTRNMPWDDVEKWEQFVEYNRQDVVTEMTIYDRLSKFPMHPFEKRIYSLDQRINDHGVLCDMDLVRKIQTFGAEHTADIERECLQLTGGLNINSITQLKQWLSAREGKPVTALTKSDVTELLRTDLQPESRRLLELRQEAGKTSVKKYEAFDRAVCGDDRLHGMFQYYGTRTGRWCLTGDHEVLTETDGWVRLDEWQGGKIATWSTSTEAIAFTNAEALEFDYSGKMYNYEDSRISQVSTPDHKMCTKRISDDSWKDDTVERMSKYRACIPITGYRTVTPYSRSNEIRILVMVQADGHYTSDGSIRLKFKKKRKIERCIHLLRQAGIPFKRFEQKDGAVTINIPQRYIPLWLRMFQDKTFGPWLFNTNPDIFFEELSFWDGYQGGPNSIQYATTNKQNADLVQAFAHLSGRTAIIRTRIPEKKNWLPCYYVNIWLTPGSCHELRNKPVISEFKGKVYCARTTTGYFLVRRNGKVWITGNSGRLVQPQNLPRNLFDDFDYARELVKAEEFEAVEMLYGSINDVFSTLVRTVFIPPEGMKLAVADYSAIEARVVAWVANEKWRQEVFRNGGDIYCESASQMFKVPVVKHGVNGHLRSKGKIAELALGYGGGVAALKAFGADKMGMSDEEMDEMVQKWRNASPNIRKLWQIVENAVKEAVNNDRVVPIQHHIKFYKNRGILFVRLPSGRSIAYARPRYDKDGFSYEGLNQTTRQWQRISAWGGKLVENIIQAIARDCLAETLLKLDEAGYQTVIHVHDEVIVEVPGEDADRHLETIESIMGSPLPWADGLYLTADGFTCDYYRKD